MHANTGPRILKIYRRKIDGPIYDADLKGLEQRYGTEIISPNCKVGLRLLKSAYFQNPCLAQGLQFL